MSDIRVIATGLSFPEGPVAMADGSIVLVEIERQTVSRVRPDGRVEVVAQMGGGFNGMAVEAGWGVLRLQQRGVWVAVNAERCRGQRCRLRIMSRGGSS